MLLKLLLQVLALLISFKCFVLSYTINTYTTADCSEGLHSDPGTVSPGNNGFLASPCVCHFIRDS